MKDSWCCLIFIKSFKWSTGLLVVKGWQNTPSSHKIDSQLLQWKPLVTEKTCQSVSKLKNINKHITFMSHCYLLRSQKVPCKQQIWQILGKALSVQKM